MESAAACQVKGCKANKKAAKNAAHDESRAHHRENNNNNNNNNNNGSCSDDDNNDETKRNTTAVGNKKQQQQQQHSKANSTSTTTNNNNKNASNNRAKAATASNEQQQQQQQVAVGYNRVVSGSYKTTTAGLPYNKVVSNGKTILDDSMYDRIMADIKTSMPPLNCSPPATKTIATPAAPSNVLGYNQVVINGYSRADHLANAPTTYLGYNKVVSSGKLNGSSGEAAAPKQMLHQQRQLPQSQQKENKTTTATTTATTTQTQTSNSEAEQRRAVLSYEQVCRLNDVMNEVVSIHGRGNFPTLEVRLRDLVTVVRGKLEEDPANGGAGLKVRDIRLNGGAASHVLATESQPYNDLDLIFGLELSSGRHYDKVKAAVLSSLFDLLPEGVSRKRITTCSLKEAYVSKMVKVNNDGDRWSLISLGNSRGHRNVELKFVDTMRRQFEFSVDSFQIVLDSLIQFHAAAVLQQQQQQQITPAAAATIVSGDDNGSVEESVTTTTTTITTTSTVTEISEANYPRVVGESVYGDFHEALYHLQKKLISTRHPEEIRGGGLLKYCNLLVKMYKAAQPEYIKTLERYMCSRFFIDFPDISQQRAKLENYLWNHFVGPEEEALKYQYLTLLHSVVEESTVCLMGHERRQTLSLIENLAYQVLCLQGQQQHHHHQQQQQQRLATSHHQTAAVAPAYVYANGYYYAPVIPTACYTCTCNSWMACSS